MFSEIEKEYRKDLLDQRFAVYYWPKAALIAVLALIFAMIPNFEYWMAFIAAVAILLGIAVLFFVRELEIARRKYPEVRAQQNLVAMVREYYNIDDRLRMDNLVADLARHNIRNENDLKLTLDYYQSRLPGDSRPNLLEWFLTMIVTVSSVTIVTYDEELGMVDLPKLFEILWATMIIVAPFLIAKLIAAGISQSRNKIDTILVEDLSYIYVNFANFKKKLEETQL